MATQSQANISVFPPDTPRLGNDMSPRRSKRGWMVCIAIFLFFAGVAAFGIVVRLRTAATIRTETAQLAVPSVSVVSPQHSAAGQEIMLPGNVQPFVSAPIYSRT